MRIVVWQSVLSGSETSLNAGKKSRRTLPRHSVVGMGPVLGGLFGFYRPSSCSDPHIEAGLLSLAHLQARGV
eukprot:6212354-Pleurochrysis_carterae.AAC.3